VSSVLLTHSPTFLTRLTHSLTSHFTTLHTALLTHSLTLALACFTTRVFSCTTNLPRVLTHSLTHSLTSVIVVTSEVAEWHSGEVTPPNTNTLTHSLTHTRTHTHPHLLTHSLTHSCTATTIYPLNPVLPMRLDIFLARFLPRFLLIAKTPHTMTEVLRRREEIGAKYWENIRTCYPEYLISL
jgi:hypothetical protein